MTKDTAELLTDEATADKIIDKLDSDKDGVIDMDEWLYNLDTYLPLKELIEKSVGAWCAYSEHRAHGRNHARAYAYPRAYAHTHADAHPRPRPRL